MKFGSIPVFEAEGKIFAHNVAGTDGRNAFRKGKPITAKDIRALGEMGYNRVYAAELEDGDINENRAARRIAQAAMGAGLRIRGHSGGQVSLVAACHGLLCVDEARLEQVNRCEGIAFATLRSYSQVKTGHAAASVKIIPYAISGARLEEALQAARGDSPLIQVKALVPRRVGVVYASSTGARQRVLSSFGPSLKRRVAALESRIAVETCMTLGNGSDEEEMAAALRDLLAQDIELILVASETSTMDANDIVPRAALSAGGQITCVGAPVEPGNLVMLAYLGDVPLLNVPGCFRSPNTSMVDQILAVLLTGERLSRAGIIRMGYGGLMLGLQHDDE